MPLNLYRRHRLDCVAGHPEESRSGEFEERSKKWKRCRCQIYAAGTLSGKFRRSGTRKWTWDEAKAVAATWESAGRWDAGETPAPPAAPVAKADPDTVAIHRAVAAFMAEHQRNSATGTIRKYSILMKKLTDFSSHRGFVTIDQWGPNDLREFRASWGVAQQTANRDMSVIRSFFEFCVCNEWLARNPGKLVKNPRGRSASDGRFEQKLPFTDAELQRMYEVAEQKYGKLEIAWHRSRHGKRAEGVPNNYRYKWTGKDLSDFISVSVYTGMRISDVATFHIDRLKENGEVRVRTTKTGTHVNTWVPDWLQTIIRRRALELGPFIFGDHDTTDMNVITDVWRRKLIRLWHLCESDAFKWSAKPTPHRFRHTFARILLERPGVEVRDVAELLGNSEQIVRKHYAAWIPERQERLTSVLRAAFQEKPRPGVVVEMPQPAIK